MPVLQTVTIFKLRIDLILANVDQPLTDVTGTQSASHNTRVQEHNIPDRDRLTSQLNYDIRAKGVIFKQDIITSQNPLTRPPWTRGVRFGWDVKLSSTERERGGG